jgi:hypothetical protein
MKRKTFFFVILILLLSPFWGDVVLAQVQIRVRVMEASNTGSGFDAPLRDLHDQLGSLFSFSSYRLLKDENVNLSPNQPISLSIPPERSLELTLINQRRVTAEIRVKISRQGKDLLTTLVRLAPGRSVSIGGPKRGEATIITALSRPKATQE